MYYRGIRYIIFRRLLQLKNDAAPLILQHSKVKILLLDLTVHKFNTKTLDSLRDLCMEVMRNVSIHIVDYFKILP
jgi:hypothetical protein